MEKVENREKKTAGGEEPEFSDLQIVEGELLEVTTGEPVEPVKEERTKISLEDESAEIFLEEEQTKLSLKKEEPQRPKARDQRPKTKDQIQYILLPLIFLTVALLGGLRLAMPAGDFLFLKPALICLIFAAFLLVIFVRARLIRLEGWFNEDFSMLENLANFGVLTALFAATVQIFNSLIPEAGLPFWIVSFCFFWSLATNLFAEFEPKKLIKSLGALFGTAFLTKYLVLSYLTAPVSESFWRGILENPTQEFFTYIFDLPRFTAGTGYIQFFAVALYLLGLFLLPPVLSEKT